MNKFSISKSDRREIIKAAGMLAIIAGLTTAALAGTNALTKDTIEKRNQDIATAARRQVIDADSFNEQTLTDDGSTVTYYEALKEGETVGYVFTVVTTGKSSGLNVMTGIDTHGVITGVKVTADNETAGYVNKVTKGGLLDAFCGLEAIDSFKLGVNIDGVSQATKTSTGVTKGVNQAVAYYTAYVKGGAAAQ